MNTTQIRFEIMALALRSIPQGTPLEDAVKIAEAIYEFVTKEQGAEAPLQ